MAKASRNVRREWRPRAGRPSSPYLYRFRSTPSQFAATPPPQTIRSGGGGIRRTRLGRWWEDPWGDCVAERTIHCEPAPDGSEVLRSEEHTSELQSLMRISYAVFCLKKNTHHSSIHCKDSKITDITEYT